MWSEKFLKHLFSRGSSASNSASLRFNLSNSNGPLLFRPIIMLGTFAGFSRVVRDFFHLESFKKAESGCDLATVARRMRS